MLTALTKLSHSGAPLRSPRYRLFDLASKQKSTHDYASFIHHPTITTTSTTTIVYFRRYSHSSTNPFPESPLNITSKLNQLVKEKILSQHPTLTLGNENINVLKSHEKFGDYKTSVLKHAAFQPLNFSSQDELFRNTFMSTLFENCEMIESVNSDGNFVNIMLRTDWIATQNVELFERLRSGYDLFQRKLQTTSSSSSSSSSLLQYDDHQKEEKKRTALVDYASPNMAKELHVGHIRSIVLGECVSRMLEYIGNYNVLRVSHVGDIGTPIGYLIAYLLHSSSPPLNSFEETIRRLYSPSSHRGLNNNNRGNNDSQITADDDDDSAYIPLSPQNDDERNEEIRKLKEETKKAAIEASPDQLTAIYTAASSRAKADPRFRELGLHYTKLLQNRSNGVVIHIWELICESSRRGFESIYRWFDASPIECGESFYVPLIPDVLTEMEEAGILHTVEEGAKCVILRGEEEGGGGGGKEVKMIVAKKDGSYLYTSTDLAALRYRVKQQRCDLVVYITDIAQRFHFNQIFAVGRKMGWIGDVDVKHIGFGVVKSESGEKLRSRKGTATSLAVLLSKAEEMAQNAINEAKYESKVDDPQRVQKLAMSAIKYFDLSHSYESDYSFSFESMLKFKGNTSSYQLYAYTRLSSILGKAEEELGDVADWCISDRSTGLYNDPYERALALCIIRYHDAVLFSYYRLTPHWMCDYLYELTSTFHTFYEKCPILTGPKERVVSRLILCYNAHKIISTCLHLLGINATRL